MLKSAWFLPVFMLLALIFAVIISGKAAAAENAGPVKGSAGLHFKDLPGVVPEAERVQKEAYRCTSDIAEVYIPRGRFEILYGDTAPRRIYNCKTESGITYSGTQMPNTQWVPGLNPHHLPK